MEHGVRDQHVCDLAAEFLCYSFLRTKCRQGGSHRLPGVVCLCELLFWGVTTIFQSHSVCTSGLDVFAGIVLRPAAICIPLRPWILILGLALVLSY